MTMIRTIERNYPASAAGRSARVRRLHVIREKPPGRDDGEWRPQTWCGQHACDVTNSAALIRDAPHQMPDGLTWCPFCIGRLADHLGRAGEVARLLGLETTTSDTGDDRP